MHCAKCNVLLPRSLFFEFLQLRSVASIVRSILIYNKIPFIETMLFLLVTDKKKERERRKRIRERKRFLVVIPKENK